MRGEDRSRQPFDRDTQRGTTSALHRAFEPERAAEASFDALIDKLRSVRGSNGGGSDVAH